MARGERHGERRKGLGHGFFHIVLLAATVESVTSGAYAKRREQSRDKADRRQRYDSQGNAADATRQQQACQARLGVLDDKAKAMCWNQRRPGAGDLF